MFPEDFVAGDHHRDPSVHRVVSRGEDPGAGMAFFDLASAAGGRVHMTVIGNAGHRFPVEYPEEFNAAVLGFCGSHRAK